jgi:DNA-binding transcriptional LysR family regulator
LCANNCGAQGFGTLPHVAISSTGDDTGFIDRSLAAARAGRRVAVRLSYLSAATVLGQSDMVATLCRRVAEAMIQTAALQLRDLPFPSPTARTSMLWHRRLESSPAHRWLRDLIVAVTRRL